MRCSFLQPPFFILLQEAPVAPQISILVKEQRKIKIKINEIKVDEKESKWIVSYMPLDIFYKDYLVEWTIIKIDKNKTMVAINNLYYEQIEPSIKKKLSEVKSILFQIMEEELRKKCT